MRETHTYNLVAELGNAPSFIGYQPIAHACRLFRTIPSE